MTRPDRGSNIAVSELAEAAGWAEASEAWELTDALRSALRPEYADASDAEMAEALGNVLESMSPAEAFNFGSALSSITNSAKKLVSDPTFIQVAKTVAPIAAGAIGTTFGGPIGGALASQLGNLAVSALTPAATPAPAAPPPAAARPGVTPAPPAAAPPPAPTPPVAGGSATSPVAGGSATSPVAGGSAAAAQGLVLSQQPDVLRSLLATALGQSGRQQVGGIPNAQILSMLSQVFGRAAADADELMYLEHQPDATESVVEGTPAGSPRWLYADLLGADNLELAEAAGWEGLG